jgi:hypothetical protein
MPKSIIDDLKDIVDDAGTGVPARHRLLFEDMIKKLVAEDLVTYETSALAASAGLATGSLFLTTAGAMMVVV